MINLLKNIFRPVKQNISSFLNLGNPPVYIPTIPIIDLNEVLHEKCPPFSLHKVTERFEEPSLYELVVLAKIISSTNPKVVFEIGTFEGGTTCNIAVNTSDDSSIYTLDLGDGDVKNIWDKSLDVYPHETGIRFKESQIENKITQLFGNSQKFDYSKFYGKIDLVFIDACHHYDHVKKDSENAFKMINSKGIIIWHDYATYAPGVIKALEEIAKEKKLQHVKDTSLVLFRNID